MSKFAWVTLTTNDTYSLGALVLAHSLRRVNTAHQLAVLVTPGVSESMRNKLKDVYSVVQEVNVMDSQDAANLALLARPELGITFTKLHCWRLVQFEKCVFLDADTLVLQNCDELFEREELSAAPDVSWPDCFNSGVFVFRPSVETFAKITEFALKNGSFDGGDQGLLNLYFADWAHTDITKHLPFIYNVTAFASYCYLPAFKQFRDKIKILHFAGKMKPWLMQFNSESKTASTPTDYAHATDLIQLWWNIFCENVHQKLTDNMNYWPGIVQRKLYEQNYHNHKEHPAQQHQHHHHHHDHQEQSYPQKQQQAQFDYENIVDYRDPWEDYYEDLEKQIRNEESHYELRRCQMQPNEPIVAQEEHSEVPTTELNETAANVNIRASTEKETRSLEQSRRNNESNISENPNDNSCNTRLDEASLDAISYTEPTSQEEDFTDYDDDDSTNTTRHEFDSERTSPNAQTHRTNTAPSSGDDDVAATAEYSLDDCTNSTDCYTTDCTETFSENVSVSEFESQSQYRDNEAGLAGALSQLRLGSQRTPEQEAYEQLMRRQCWESGQIDYSGADSFENIWKKITQTLEQKPSASPSQQDENSEHLTSADIEDGKIEYDPQTKASTQYKLIDGGYEMVITTPQQNGTVKTQVKTFWDPKPVSEEDRLKEVSNKKVIKSRIGKEVRIDKNTTMLTREIPGGYEEVYTTVNDDGSRSMRTKTFFDSVQQEINDDSSTKTTTKTDKAKNKRTQLQQTRTSSVDSTDSTESRKIVQKVQQQRNTVSNTQNQQSNFSQESTVEETRRVTENIEITENNRSVRKNSVQEQSMKSITQTSGTSSDNKDLKKKKKTKSSIPPPPPDFIENDTTTVASKRVNGGVEYTYSTQLESGKTITTTKTVYEEEEIDMTEEDIREYKKTLKDAEKHKNVTTTKKLKSESGTKKIVPSENLGDVTTVETIKIQGGTEYHYTTVTAEGIVKKATKTIYDPVPCNKNPDESEEEEIIEEYEEEIIEPGEKNIRTIETVKTLPQKFEEEVTITHEKKERKVKKSMMISN